MTKPNDCQLPSPHNLKGRPHGAKDIETQYDRTTEKAKKHIRRLSTPLRLGITAGQLRQLAEVLDEGTYGVDEFKTEPPDEEGRQSSRSPESGIEHIPSTPLQEALTGAASQEGQPPRRSNQGPKTREHTSIKKHPTLEDVRPVTARQAGKRRMRRRRQVVTQEGVNVPTKGTTAPQVLQNIPPGLALQVYSDRRFVYYVVCPAGLDSRKLDNVRGWSYGRSESSVHLECKYFPSVFRQSASRVRCQRGVLTSFSLDVSTSDGIRRDELGKEVLGKSHPPTKKAPYFLAVFSKKSRTALWN